MENYLLNISDLKDLSLNEVIEKLKSTSGLPLKWMTIENLVFHNNTPIYSGNGVYIFKEKENFIYVGNCIARNFVERIPAHFDIRSGGWFHSLLLNIIKKKHGSKIKKNELLTEAAKYAFDNYSLILINYDINSLGGDSMNKLETLLRTVLNPYNGFKTKNFAGDSSATINNFI